MRVPKRFIPGFPSCRFKWLENKLRDLHLKLFRGYYDVFIPPSMTNGGKGVYIWNGGPEMTSDEIVSAQPFTGMGVDCPWEFVSSDGTEETSDDLCVQISKKWQAYFLAIGQPGEEERLAEIREMSDRALKLVRDRD